MLLLLLLLIYLFFPRDSLGYHQVLNQSPWEFLS